MDGIFAIPKGDVERCLVDEYIQFEIEMKRDGWVRTLVDGSPVESDIVYVHGKSGRIVSSDLAISMYAVYLKTPAIGTGGKYE